MEFSRLTEERRSVRSYSETPVTKEQIEELMKAVQLAPTWKNSQTGRYYAACSEEAIGKIAAALPGFNQRSSKNAALIVTTFVKDIAGFTNGTADNELGNQWGAYDLGLQNAYLVLKASDMGLDTLIMGLRDEAVIRKELNIPENEIIAAVIALGHGNVEKKISPRKDLAEILKLY